MQKNKCNNILIINDSATLNILLKLTLEAEGYLIEISETRPISKTIHFVANKLIRGIKK